jgi:hypothetical protein
MSDDPRDPSSAKFLRGLTIGALIGAVIAGSSIWGRWFASRDRGPTRATPAVPSRKDP